MEWGKAFGSIPNVNMYIYGVCNGGKHIPYVCAFAQSFIAASNKSVDNVWSCLRFMGFDV